MALRRRPPRCYRPGLMSARASASPPPSSPSSPPRARARLTRASSRSPDCRPHLGERAYTRDHPLAGKIRDGRAGAVRDRDGARERARRRGPRPPRRGARQPRPPRPAGPPGCARLSPPGGARRSRSRCSPRTCSPTWTPARAPTPRGPDVLAEPVSGRRAAGRTSTLYPPISRQGSRPGLPMVAANLPRAQAKTIVATGRDGLDDGLRAAARARGAASPPPRSPRCARR